MCMYGKCQWNEDMKKRVLEQLKNLPDDASVFTEHSEAGEEGGKNEKLPEDDENRH